jgi:hypothetical protein
MKRLVIAPLIALSLAGCETTATAPYTQAAGPQAVGFSEIRLEQDRYRVTYRGSARVDQARVEDLALLRAADLALANGYDWFRVVDRFGDVTGPRGPMVSLGTGGASFGGHTSVGLGLGTSFALGGSGSRVVTLEVQFGRGSRPNDRDAYDAADVSRSIRARL